MVSGAMIYGINGDDSHDRIATYSRMVVIVVPMLSREMSRYDEVRLSA